MSLISALSQQIKPLVPGYLHAMPFYMATAIRGAMDGRKLLRISVNLPGKDYWLLKWQSQAVCLLATWMIKKKKHQALLLFSLMFYIRSSCHGLLDKRVPNTYIQMMPTLSLNPHCRRLHSQGSRLNIYLKIMFYFKKK